MQLPKKHCKTFRNLMKIRAQLKIETKIYLELDQNFFLVKRE